MPNIPSPSNQLASRPSKSRRWRCLRPIIVCTLFLSATAAFSSSAQAIPPDAYEANNTLQKARLIAHNQSQQHTIHRNADVDWIRFKPTAATPAGYYNMRVDSITVPLRVELWYEPMPGTWFLRDMRTIAEGLSRQEVALRVGKLQ